MPWVLLFGEFRDVTKPLRDRIATQRETSRVLVGPENGDFGMVVEAPG